MPNMTSKKQSIVETLVTTLSAFLNYTFHTCYLIGNFIWKSLWRWYQDVLSFFFSSSLYVLQYSKLRYCESRVLLKSLALSLILSYFTLFNKNLHLGKQAKQRQKHEKAFLTNKTVNAHTQCQTYSHFTPFMSDANALSTKHIFLKQTSSLSLQAVWSRDFVISSSMNLIRLQVI